VSGGVGQVVLSGPVVLALPVAMAAGALTFLSPCVLPLVPGYLSYITGMSGSAVTDGARQDSGAAAADAAGSHPAAQRAPAGTVAGRGAAAVGVADRQSPPGRRAAAALPRAVRGRAAAGTALFVLGFSALFAVYGSAAGALGSVLRREQRPLRVALGLVVIVLGLLFAGAFDRFSFAGRIMKPTVRPRAGLAGAPLLGVLFGLSWTPCIGPTLSAVLNLGLTAGTAGRGAVLAFGYALGLGVPFIAVSLAVDRGMRLLGFARRHARMITRIGGLMLITIGVLEVTGTWAAAMTWLQVHWLVSYTSPL
jgi:cytochrome c-type biogenesis protein